MNFSKCHPDRKVKARGLCNSCYEKDRIQKNPNIRLRKNQLHREWVKRNPDYIIKHKQRKVEKYQNNKLIRQRIYNSSIKRKYNITINEYNMIYNSQNQKCFICHSPYDTKKKLYVDHCHSTGRVRGLLCNQCNLFMGLVDKDREILIRIFSYGTRKLDWTDYVLKIQQEIMEQKKIQNFNDNKEELDDRFKK